VILCCNGAELKSSQLRSPLAIRRWTLLKSSWILTEDARTISIMADATDDPIAKHRTAGIVLDNDQPISQRTSPGGGGTPSEALLALRGDTASPASPNAAATAVVSPATPTRRQYQRSRNFAYAKRKQAKIEAAGITAKPARKRRTASVRKLRITIPSSDAPAPGKSRGGPSRYRPEYDAEARNLCLLGYTDTEIAEVFDVSIGTLMEWKKRYPSFSASIRTGGVIADGQMAAALDARAVGHSRAAVKIHRPRGEKEPVIEPYIQHHAPDSNAAKFWLMNRQGKRWRERQEIDAKDSLASQTPEQRLAAVVELMAKARAVLDATPDDDDVTDCLVRKD
jgi:hypothetical protein